jgi:hypothetical protein
MERKTLKYLNKMIDRTPKHRTGSKERFIELINKVNNIKLDENFDNTDKDKVDIVYDNIDKLLGDTFTPERGGTCKPVVQMNNNNIILTINCTDIDDNTYFFKLFIRGDENFDDNIFAADDIKLVEHTYNSYDDKVVFELRGDDLNDYNNSNNDSDLIEVLMKYSDINVGDENNTEEEDDINENVNDDETPIDYSIDYGYGDSESASFVYDNIKTNQRSPYDTVRDSYENMLSVADQLGLDTEYNDVVIAMKKMLSKHFDDIVVDEIDLNKELTDSLLGYKPMTFGFNK